MKVFILAYARKNVGDDLFIKMLLERFPNNEYYMKTWNYDFLNYLDKYKNLHVLAGKDTAEELNNSDVNEYDAYIFVGGSIFIEGGNLYKLSKELYDFVKKCKEANKPFCYVSSNFGPYQTQEYLDWAKKIFTECTDICFRDTNSYNMFKNIKSVRYAPDYVFSLKIRNTEKIKDSVGISVINLDIRKDLKEKQEEYLDLLQSNIQDYLDAGKTVYLFSFCEYEGDEKTIEKILERFDYDPRIKEIRYKGSLGEYLQTYYKMEYMLCARFHSIVLSSISGQKMYIMSYSKKIDNVINDLELDIPMIQFNEFTADTKINLDKFTSIPEEKLAQIAKSAKEQDAAIRKFLN